MATPRFSIEIDGTRLAAASLARLDGLDLSEADGTAARRALRVGLGPRAAGAGASLDGGGPPAYHCPRP